MNSNEFAQNVRKKVGARASTVAIEQAIQHVSSERGQKGVFFLADVAEAVEYAGRLPAPETNKSSDASHFGGRDIIDSDLICDAWEPKVLEIRRRLFGSEEPPFPDDMDRAAAWLEETAKANPKTSTGEFARVRQLRTEICQITGFDVVLTQRFVAFPRATTNPQTGDREVWVHRVIARGGTDLYQLSDEITEIASAVFDPAVITQWIFTGVRPLMPRLRISTSTTFQGQASGVHLPPRASVTITIYARDLTWDELLKAYKAVRSAPTAKRQKVPALHLRIYQLVREHGARGSMIPADHGTKQQFWESILKEVQKDKRFKGQVPTGWEAIRKAYLSLVSMKESTHGRIRPRKTKR